MAQFYTLDEAAGRLGVAPDDFKRRLKHEWTAIRPFRDGATLRFRAADIDELARTLGAASDPGLTLGPVGAPPAESADDFTFTAGDHPAAVPGYPVSFATPDDFPLPAAARGDSGILSPPPPAKSDSDSDVRLDFAPPRGHDPAANHPTEEIALDVAGPGSTVIRPSGASSGKLSAGKSGARLAGPESGKSGTRLGGEAGKSTPRLSGPPSARIPSPMSKPPADKSDSSSEFELSLDADSDSFELQLTGDSSEEVDLGGPPAANRGGQSGINLGKPMDSGVSLEKKGQGGVRTGGASSVVRKGPGPAVPPPAADGGDADLDFELTADAPAGAGQGPKSVRSARLADDSSSEFELSLDDHSGVSEAVSGALEAPSSRLDKGDIFETDFELPVVADESGSEVVSVDAADTDLENTGFEVDLNDLDAPAEDDSASQVVLVDDDAPLIEDDAPAPRGRRAALADDDALGGDLLEEGASASAALRGVNRGEAEAGPVRTVAAPPKWGPLPALVLFPTLTLMFLGGLMSFELLRGMWGYHQPTRPGAPLVRGVADAFGMKVND